MTNITLSQALMGQRGQMPPTMRQEKKLPGKMVAQSSDLKNLQAVLEKTGMTIAPGDKGAFVLEGWGIGPLADMATAEKLFGETFLPEGLKILDVYGEGWSKAVIVFTYPLPVEAAQGHASMGLGPIALGVIVGLVILALIALGWVISQASLFLEKGGPAIQFGVGLVIAMVALLLVGPVLSGAKKGYRT